MIGRDKEKQELMDAYQSDYSEFVAIYGRRRIGKTFLVRETFDYQFTFQHSGNSHAPMAKQLEAWFASLKNYGWKGEKIPETWIEAFAMLNGLIKASRRTRKVVFIDEMPWMDTPRSFFVSALEYFWNNMASARRDVLLIVCGSATSWIIIKIIKNHGGLHNRVTRQIQLQPFTLNECEHYAKSMKLAFDRYAIIKGYMVFGGVPYYWSLLKKGLSIDQNIDQLVFNPTGRLHSEFDELYDSLFRSPEDYIKVVTVLGRVKIGMTREELIEKGKITNNGKLSRILGDLEHCGFIRKYKAIGSAQYKAIYQLMDSFTLFHFKFVQENKTNDPDFWMHSIDTPTYNAWNGLAFERVCFQHVAQLKQALGISGVQTNVFAWQVEASDDGLAGAQIDMVIDRDDHVANLCEMKFSDEEYRLSSAEDKRLRHRKNRLQEVLSKRKSIFITLITPYGLVRNEYASNVQNEITGNELFK